MADKKDDNNEPQTEDDGKTLTHAQMANATRAEAPVEHEGMSDEERAAAKDYEEHQEALRTGGGDTRVNPKEGSWKEPKVLWPLEQATVDVDIHQHGSTVTVRNDNPLPPPTGTATGVAPRDIPTPNGPADSLQDAVSPQEVKTVDVAADAIKTPEEVEMERTAPNAPASVKKED